MIAHPDVLKAQQQAAARVQEMEERSRRFVREQPVNVYRGVAVASPCPAPKPPVPETPCAPVCPPAPVCGCENSRTLSLFGGDNERLLLLLLAGVLAKNGAPLELLLALLYVAL